MAKKRLGRGLDALLSKPTVAISRPDSAAAETSAEGLKNIPLELLQYRRDWLYSARIVQLDNLHRVALFEAVVRRPEQLVGRVRPH